MGRPWTHQEVSILVSTYSKHGPHITVRRLRNAGHDRTYRSVTWKASRLGHQVGIPKGYMSLNELCNMMFGVSQVYKFVKHKAQREDVLYYSEGAVKVRYAVPEEWAFEVADDYSERLEVEHSGWPRTKDVEHELGLPHRKVYDILSGKTYHPLASMLRNVEKRQGKTRHWHWNPEGVESVKRAMRAS